MPHQTAIPAAVFAGSTALTLFLNWHLRFDLGDDAYIHLRIAHNMIRTGHPYFNLGERVMVTSSPVWTLLLVLNELVFGARNILWMWNALFVGVAATAAYWLAWSQLSVLVKRTGGCPASKLNQELSAILAPENQFAEAKP